jgi:hypothetical protein
VNCAQFGSAKTNSNFPQEKTERTHYARAQPRPFARPGPRDAASSRPSVASHLRALYRSKTHAIHTISIKTLGHFNKSEFVTLCYALLHF